MYVSQRVTFLIIVLSSLSNHFSMAVSKKRKLDEWAVFEVEEIDLAAVQSQLLSSVVDQL